MAPFSWSRWLRSVFRPQARTIRRRRAESLGMEQLETRLAPATFIWTGAGKTNHWSDNANWFDQDTGTPQAPSGLAANLDNLVFPGGPAQTTTQNDLPAGSTFGSISFSGVGYTLQGNAIVLGSSAVSGSGSVNVGAGLNVNGGPGETIKLNVQLGAAASDRQFFNVDQSAVLEIDGHLSGTTGTTLAKDLPGELILAADNSGFTGNFSVDPNGGILQITNSKALGTASSTTTVDNNAQLQVSNVTGAIQQSLILNGSGIMNDGALLNVAGKNTWAGNVLLDSDVTFGANGPSNGSVLTITGQISDAGAGHNVTKEGTGKVAFASANSYRGTTTINNGVLDVENANALGQTDGTSLTGTTVTETVTAGGTIIEAGTLQLEDPSGKGFTVDNVLLTLNGPGSLDPTDPKGVQRLGALENVAGFNTWTGDVILGSVAPNGHNVVIQTDSTDPPYTLTLSGQLSEPNGTYTLTKTGPATLILTHANTYTGSTFVNNGTLTITDSQALGNSPLTTVAAGATLELSVANKSTPDSVTGTTNSLSVSEPLSLTGPGAGNLGALYSESGINTYTGQITLTAPTFPAVTNTTSIGVNPDPNPTASNAYLADDFSLTITGNLVSTTRWPNYQTLHKVGKGNLILPDANPRFAGNVTIDAGWVTVENDTSLGTHVNGVGDTQQPTVTVASGAALHLDPQGGSNMIVGQNLALAGTGLVDPTYGLIRSMGAVENLAGINTLTGNVTLLGQVGIGVENVFGASDLTMTGSMNEKMTAQAIVSNATASGGTTENDNVVDTGANSGTVIVNYNMYYVPDRLDIYYGVFGQPGAVDIKNTGGPVSGSGTLQVNYAPIGNFSSNFITIVMNQGGGETGTFWTYTATIVPQSTLTGNGGITKLGSQKLNILGDGTYTGPVDVQQGVLRDQNDTGLGAGVSTTTVEAAQPTVQALTLSSGVPGSTTFQLSLGGSQTAPISYTGTSADATAIQNALNALPSVSSLGGTISVVPQVGASFGIASISEVGTTVTVTTVGNNGFSTGQQVTIAGVKPAGYNGTFAITATGPNQFTYTAPPNLGAASVSGATASVIAPGAWTITYGGGLTTFDESLGASVSAGPGSIAVVTQRHGGGAALELGLTNPGNNGGVTRGLQVQGEHLILNGTGNTTFNDAPLTVLPGSDQAWRGLVTLDNSVPIQVPTSSRITLYGAVDDAANKAPGGSGMTLKGGGGLNLAGSNTYRGTTTVSSGVLTVQSSQALGGTGVAEVQTITLTGVTPGVSQFTLGFTDSYAPSDSGTTAPITFQGTAADAAAIQAALNGLPAIAAAGGTLTVKQTSAAPGTAFGTQNVTFTVTFGGGMIGFQQSVLAGSVTNGIGTIAVAETTAGGGGTVVANGAALRLQGNITVAGEPLIVQGQGLGSPSSFPVQWNNIGPAPETNEDGFGNVSGRATGVAVDPTDPNVIYIATAGGGAWKTVNGGQTWQPIFDASYAMYGGAIAVAPSDPRVIYFGTGEADNSGDSFAGSGVYKSIDSGRTWALLTGTKPTNPMAGLAVSKIVIDPGNPNVIFVATSDLQTNGQQQASKVNPSLYPTPTVGVWRHDGSNWFDLTSVVSPERNPSTSSKGGAAPNTPGPDDDFRLSFPQVSATWSDLALVGSSRTNNLILYAALGTDFLPGVGPGDPANAVYRCENATSNTPAWYIGDDTKTDGEASTEFPTNLVTGGIPQEGTIKVTAFANPSNFVLLPAPANNPPATGITLYASIAIPDGSPNSGALFEILVSTDGGVSWKAVPTAPLLAPDGSTYLGGQGNYDQAIAIDPNDATGQTFYVGGQSYFSPQYPGGTANNTNQIQKTTDGGNTWTDVSVDASGNGPHTDTHGLAVALTSTGVSVFTVDDGGVYRYDAKGGTWTDINGNLATNTVNGVAVDPNNPNFALEGSQDNGVALYSGNPAWNFLFVYGDGGLVRIDPQNPNNLYEVKNGGIYKSTKGAATTGSDWTQILQLNAQYPYFVLDPVNPQRLLVGDIFPGTQIQESLDGGTTWQSLSSPIQVTALGAAGYQGQFVPDNSFKLVTDRGANTDDPNTIYVTDGSKIFLTKNHGTTWVDRTPSILPAAFSGISGIVIDPTNRDHAFLISNAPEGTAGFGKDRVLVTSNAGQSWSDISNGLPDVPVYSLVVDPRTPTTLYVGTDQGVYYSTNSGATWSVFGVGLPQVAVTDLALNQNLNTLTAGTYGRSIWQVSLESVPANAGALSAASGTSVWTGHIFLAGNTAIGADGTSTVATDVVGPQLNIQGAISDLIAGTNSALTKVGPGNVILSGANTYGGLTTVQTGSLIVHNAQALGGTINGTVVAPNAALKLQSSVLGEPLTIQGNGPSPGFNGHATGALENVSGNNTYSGPITLAAFSTVGVDSGSSLTISGPIGDNGAGNGLIKELTGTLVLTNNNTYTGGTAVNQGVLNVQAADALGNNPSTGTTTATTVLDGAQLQVQAPAGTAGIEIDNENLRLSGTGIGGTGALEGVGGGNTWGGNITLAEDPGQNPTTNPPPNVAIGVLYAPTDFLRVSGVIGQAVPFQGINKVGAGSLVLDNNANTYTGLTQVSAGTVRVQQNGALGTPGTSSQQGVIVTSKTGGGSFTLTFNGQTTPALNFGAPAGQVQQALSALSTVGGVGGSATVTLSGNVYSISFGGTLGFGNAPALTATGSGGVNAAVTTNGTLVLPGAAVEVDGDPTGIGASLTVAGEGLTLNGNGVQEAQQVTVTGSSGTFTLGFGGKNTPALAPGASAAQVQAALNGLTTIGNAGGSVTVTASPAGANTTVYTIIFGGSLGNAHQPALTASGTGGTTASVVIARDGGTGALHNISGANAWTGPVVLASADSIGVEPATSLTVSGTVEDPIATPVPPATLTKVGAGELILPSTNTYTGLTQVNGGILNVQGSSVGSASPLGAVVSEVQTVTLSGPQTGTFTLSFNGKTTAPLSFLIPATGGTGPTASLQNALTSLSTIGAGNVLVTRSGSIFTVTFTGALAGQSLPAMVGVGQLGVTATVAIATQGSQGTVVVPGATLQLQGGVTINTESLTLSGNGAPEIQQVLLTDLFDPFTLSFNGQTTAPLAPGAGAPQVQAALNALSSIGGVGGSVTVSQTPDASGVLYTIVFGGSLTGTNPALLVASQPNSQPPSVNELQRGGGGANEVQQVLLPDSFDPFTLTFEGSTTGPLAANADPGTIASALNALDTISSAGAVDVTQGTTANGVNYYVITFDGGDLAGFAQPLLVADQPNSQPPAVGVFQAGNTGALDSPSGDNTWSSAITLAGNTSIGSDVDSTNTPSVLTLNTGIAQSSPSTLTKVGTGVAVLAGGAANTYSGMTTVSDGTLQLAKTGGALAVPTNLTVGDAAGAAPDVVQLEGNNQINSAATVTVLSDGVMDLNGNSQTIAALQMTGGLVTITGATAQLTVTGSVTAAADALGIPAVVTGAGPLALSSSTPTITVNGPGPGAPGPDMILAAPLTTSTRSFTKAGGGVLQVLSTNPTLNATAAQGTLLADSTSGTTLADVTLQGGTLGGTGSVNSVTPAAGTGGGGIVLPGDSAVNPGTLTTATSDPQTWGTTTTLDVVLNDINPGDFSQLVINGDLNLNGAGLGGFASAFVNLGDTFTILQVAPGSGGAITGDFAQPFGTEPAGSPAAGETVVFVGGQKYDVAYLDAFGNAYATTQASPNPIVAVELTRNIATATLTLSSSTGTTKGVPNPSVYGQAVTFTATVTPQNGAGQLPSTDTVTFYLDYGSGLPGFTTRLVNGTATFDPQDFYGQFLSVGTHTISATFNGDNTFAPTPADDSPDDAPTFTQVVGRANTVVSMTSSPANPVPGQLVTVTATFSPVSPGAGVPGGVATFIIDGNTNPASEQVVALNAAGQAILQLTTLSASTHRIQVFYTGDNTAAQTVSVTGSAGTFTLSFNGATTASLPVAVSATAVQNALNALSTIGGVGGSVTVTGSSGNFVVTFGGKLLGQAVPDMTGTGQGGAAVNVTTLATPVGDYNGIAQPGQTLVTVAKGNAVLRMSSTPVSSFFGQVVTFTATVTGPVAPTGTITFYNGSVTQANILAANVPVDATGVATFSTSALSTGTHNIIAAYSGSSSYLGSNTSTELEAVNVSGSAGTFTLSFNGATTVSLPVSAPAAGGVGAAASVQNALNALSTIGGVGGSVTVTGSNGNFVVTFGGKLLGQTLPDMTGSGQGGADVTVTVLAAPLNFVVAPAGTTTSLTTSANPSAFGTALTLTASVAVVSPGLGTPTGLVTFLDGSTVLGTGVLAPNGRATFSTKALSVGTHSLVASYGGAANFAGSDSSSAPVAELVQVGAVVVVSSSANPAVFGQIISLTAAVKAQPPGVGTPAAGETVVFTDATTGNALGQQQLDSNGIAVLTGIDAGVLGIGIHQIKVSYPGDTTFLPGTGTLNVTVIRDPSTTTVSASGPTVYGQTVTFTASVAAASPGAGMPTGNVFFYDGSRSNPIGSGALSPAGSVATTTVSTSSLSAGTHSILVIYADDPSFAGSQTTFSYTVGQATTGTTVSETATASAPGQAVYSEAVTLTANVGVLTGAGTPTGNVTFTDTVNGRTTTLGSGKLNGGVATLVVSNLSVASHTLNAAYVGSQNFAASSTVSAGGVSVVVSPDGTNTALTSSANPSASGQRVTLSATVVAAFPGTATPTGNVTFTDTFNGATTTLGSGTLNAKGVATFAIGTLAFGTHSITATYNTTTNFTTSTSAPLAQTVLYGSGTTVSESLATSAFQQTVTYTATVASKTPGSVGTPSGTVNFYYDGTNLIDTGILSPISATAATTTVTFNELPVGAHTITAVYAPDGASNFVASTSAGIREQVNKANTTTALSGSDSAITYGNPVTFTAVVTPAFAGSVLPTKTVTFYDRGAALGTATLDATGTATFTTTTLAANVAHSVTAKYNGDGNFNASPASAGVGVTVAQSGTATTLTSSADDPLNPGTADSLYSVPVTFSATVVAVPPGAGTPNGQVAFFVDGATRPSATVTLNASGVARWVVSNLSINATGHVVTAVYVGNGNYASSPSASDTLFVSPDDSNATVSSSANPSITGQAVTFTATLSAANGGVGKPTGKVTFLDGSTVLGSGNLTNGIATLVTNALGLGTHSISVSYAGDSNFNGTASAAITQTVQNPTVSKWVAFTNPTPVPFSNSLSNPRAAFSLTVEALDGNNHPVGAVNGATVTVVLTSQPKPGSASFSTLTGTIHNGVITFANLNVIAAGSYTVQVTVDGYTSFSFTFTTSGRAS